MSPTIRLNNGFDIPVIGLGTSQAENCEQAVKDAIDCGYRHIDTAFYYGTETEVGKGVNAKIAEGVIKREDIFITTKLSYTSHEPDQVEAGFNKSLENLDTEYVDLFLMHTPMAHRQLPTGEIVFLDVDYVDTWKAMEKLLKSGRVRSIGVSNFNSEQIDRLLASAEIKPVVNQVECHPNFNQRKFLKFHSDRNIVLVAYAPLGRPQEGKENLAINDPTVLNLAKKHNKTSAQIILRHTLQNGAVVIPKSTNMERIRSNFDIFDFSLSDEDMQIINSLNTNTRLFPFHHTLGHKYFPFNIEF